MSSNIEIQRICQLCGNEFTARTTVTRYCGDVCAKRAYKIRQKTAKYDSSNKETLERKSMGLEEIKAKEFLSVREVAILLNCSVRSVYSYIESGSLKAVNLSQRTTRIKRSDIDKIFDQTNKEDEPELLLFDMIDCYHLPEIQRKYGISEEALLELIKKNRIPKTEKGLFTYVPKYLIDKLLN